MRRILRSRVISSTSTKESVLGSSVLRPRVADARRDLQRAELHRLVDIDVEGDDAAGDLVDAGELGDRIADALGMRRRQAARQADGKQGGEGQSRADHPANEEWLEKVIGKSRQVAPTNAAEALPDLSQRNYRNCGDKSPVAPASAQLPGVQAS